MIKMNETVADVIARLEREITERTEALSVLKRYTGTVASPSKPTVIREPLKAHVSAQQDTPLATRCIYIIREQGHPLSNGELKILLGTKGLSLGKGATAKIHTALGRRSREVRRTPDGKWALRAGDTAKATPAQESLLAANQ